jgi:hypothetical protein
VEVPCESATRTHSPQCVDSNSPATATTEYLLVWKIIRPKFEAILEKHRFDAAQMIIKLQHKERVREFRPFWNYFVDARPWNAEQPWAFPQFADACQLPAIDEILSENELKIPVTVERWSIVVESVPDELNEFTIQVLRDVITLLEVPDLDSNHQVDDADDMDLCIFFVLLPFLREPGSFRVP